MYIVMVKSKRILPYSIDDEEAKILRAKLRKFSIDYKDKLEVRDIDMQDSRLREILLPLLNSTPKSIVKRYAEVIIDALTKDRSEEESEKFEAKVINAIDSIK
ncbi:MAG: hypothetical protein KatS3mg003_0644 [Candidatus Nitrosocaldaceae archaeon]|nr:MAG: hypothetical protein KatS3mg003_0644 [Candidatus Nitrosocaldaceae archaeon]